MMIEPDYLILAVAVAAVLAYLAWPAAPAQQKKRARALHKLRQSHRYWGVSVRDGRCPTARRLAGKGFSIDTAPALPISGCNSGRCTCSYSGLSERRLRNRRSSASRRESIRFDSNHPERRTQRDARKAFRNKWLDPAN